MKRRIRQSMCLVRYILTPELSLNDDNRPKAPRHSLPSDKHLKESVKVWIWFLISILVSLAVGQLH